MERGAGYDLLFLIGDDDLPNPSFGVTGRKIRRHQGLGLRHQKNALSLNDVTARERSPRHDDDVTSRSWRSFTHLSPLGNDVTKRISNPISPSVQSEFNNFKHTKIPGIVTDSLRHDSDIIDIPTNVNGSDGGSVNQKSHDPSTKAVLAQPARGKPTTGDSPMANQSQTMLSSLTNQSKHARNHDNKETEDGGSYEIANANLDPTSDKENRNFKDINHTTTTITTTTSIAPTNTTTTKNIDSSNDNNNDKSANKNNNKNSNNNQSQGHYNNTIHENNHNNNMASIGNNKNNNNNMASIGNNNNDNNSMASIGNNNNDNNNMASIGNNNNNNNMASIGHNKISIRTNTLDRRRISFLQNLTPVSVSANSAGGVKPSHFCWSRTRRPEVHYPYTIVTPVLELETGNTTPFIVRGNCLGSNHYQATNDHVSLSSVSGNQNPFETKYRYQYSKSHGRPYLARNNSHRKLGSASERSRVLTHPTDSFPVSSAITALITTANTSSTVSIPYNKSQTSVHHDAMKHTTSHPVDSVVNKILQRHHRQFEETQQNVSERDTRIGGMVRSRAGDTVDIKPTERMNVHWQKSFIDFAKDCTGSHHDVEREKNKVRDRMGTREFTGDVNIDKNGPTNIKRTETKGEECPPSKTVEGVARIGPTIAGSKCNLNTNQNNSPVEFEHVDSTLEQAVNNADASRKSKADEKHVVNPIEDAVSSRSGKHRDQEDRAVNVTSDLEVSKCVPDVCVCDSLPDVCVCDSLNVISDINQIRGERSQINDSREGLVSHSKVPMTINSKKIVNKDILEIKYSDESAYDPSNGKQNQKPESIINKDISYVTTASQRNVDNIIDKDTAHNNYVDKDTAHNNNVDKDTAHNKSVDKDTAHNNSVDKDTAHNNSVDKDTAHNNSVVPNGVHIDCTSNMTKKSANNVVHATKSDRKVSDWIIFRDYKTTGMGGYGDKYNVWTNSQPKYVNEENSKLAPKSNPGSRIDQSAQRNSYQYQNLGTYRRSNLNSNDVVAGDQKRVYISNSQRNNNSTIPAQRKQQQQLMSGTASKIYWKFTDMTSLRTKNSNRNMFLPSRSISNETHQWRPSSRDSNGRIIQWNQEVIPESRPNSRNTPRSMAGKNSVYNRNNRTFLRIGSAGIPGHPIANFSFVQKYRPISRESLGQTSRPVVETPRPFSQQMIRRNSPDIISKSDAAQFIHEVNALQTPTLEDSNSRQIDSESTQEMLDYFWSYQGMSRQMLGVKSADRRMDKGTQQKKLSVDAENKEIKQSSPLQSSTLDNKRLEYEESQIKGEDDTKHDPQTDRRTVRLVVKLPDMTSDKE